MTAHSLLGASGAHRWLNCPGSFALSQQLPHRRSSIYAAAGTVAHQYIEKAAHQYIEKAQANSFLPLNGSIIGDPWSCDGHTGVVDQDFVDGINVMLEYLHAARTRAAAIQVEFQVSLDRYFQNPPVPLFGTVDAAIGEWGVLEIADYKNGAGVVVSPVENPQMLFYAAGVVTPAMLAQLDRVKLTIVQPHAGGNPIRSWEIAPVDLMMWVDEVLVPGVEACTQPDAPLVPGSWCRFCPVSHGCPELHKAAVEMAKLEFDDLPANPGELSLALGQALDLAERAEIWITRLRDFAIDKLQDQQPIEGWGLVPTRPTRQWRDETNLLTCAQQRGFERALYETRLRSPAQLEKHLIRTSDGKRHWLDIVEGGLIEARSTGVKLGRSTPAAEEFIDDE